MEAHLWVHFRSRCDIFDCHPEELLYVHAHNSCEILFDKVQLDLTEIPDQLYPSQVEQYVSMFAELLQPGGRGLVFHGKQGSRIWSDSLLKHPGLCMEKDVLSVVREPQVIHTGLLSRIASLASGSLRGVRGCVVVESVVSFACALVSREFVAFVRSSFVVSS